MTDPTDHDIAAMLAGSQMAGEYLDEIKKFDLSTFSESEWMTLVEVICSAFLAKRNELYASGEPPF